MTRYHGGKQRIGKEIAKIISEKVGETDIEIHGYCEPFCGMLGVYQHIPQYFENRDMSYKAGDANESVIRMWQDVQQGWKPPISCSEERYNELKKQETYSAEKAYIGYQFSFGGQFFMGYNGKYGNATSYKSVPEKVYRIARELKDVEFNVGSYTQFSNLRNHVIYCDPPYANTKCTYSEKFDNNSFWNWVREMNKTNVIFISEYSAPDDFECVYENKKKIQTSAKRVSSGCEKLFMKI